MGMGRVSGLSYDRVWGIELVWSVTIAISTVLGDRFRLIEQFESKEPSKTHLRTVSSQKSTPCSAVLLLSLVKWICEPRSPNSSDQIMM